MKSEQRLAAFERKPDFSLRPVTVEKSIHLSAEEYEQFLSKPMMKYDFLKENAEQMQVDSQGTYHCLLVTGKGHIGGVLVQSEGAEYARYASYVPEAAALQYASLSAFGARLADAVDYIIRDGTSETTEGNWIVGFKQLEFETGICVADKQFLQELLEEMLLERPEVADVQIEDDSFDVCYHLDFCVNCQAGAEENGVWENEVGENRTAEQNYNRLSDLLESHWENVHLMYDDMDTVPHTIVELDANTLTEAGKEAWADVLGAQVLRVYQGYYGLQMDLTGVRAGRIDAFSAMLGGYCSVEEYELWVNEDDMQDGLTMTET